MSIVLPRTQRRTSLPPIVSVTSPVVRRCALRNTRAWRAWTAPRRTRSGPLHDVVRSSPEQDRLRSLSLGVGALQRVEHAAEVPAVEVVLDARLVARADGVAEREVPPGRVLRPCLGRRGPAGAPCRSVRRRGRAPGILPTGTVTRSRRGTVSLHEGPPMSGLSRDPTARVALQAGLARIRPMTDTPVSTPTQRTGRVPEYLTVQRP